MALHKLQSSYDKKCRQLDIALRQLARCYTKVRILNSKKLPRFFQHGLKKTKKIIFFSSYKTGILIMSREIFISFYLFIYLLLQ